MNISRYLEKTLFELLKSKSIDDIYVIDIINDIGTCKGTFYKYYRDKYDLLQHCFKKYIYADIPNTSKNWEEFILRCLTAFEENHSVVVNSFRSTDINSIRYYNELVICEFIAQERKKLGFNTEGAIYEHALKMFSSYITEDIIIDWLKTGCKTPKAELAHLTLSTMPVVLCS